MIKPARSAATANRLPRAYGPCYSILDDDSLGGALLPYVCIGPRPVSAELPGAAALDACERLVDLHAWPINRLDPNGWLDNFGEPDKSFAAHMLSRFMFFSDELVNALFLAAFQSISNRIRTQWQPRAEANREWNQFLNSAYITIVQGEVPNVSDSGFLFARKARQILGMPQEQLLSPEEALRAALTGFCGPIIFVDDFVGSGSQFLSTWTRRYLVPGYGPASYADLPAARSAPICYCTAMLTEVGRENIMARVPQLLLATGNLIPSTYCWTDPTSLLWPEDWPFERRQQAVSSIERISARLGFTDDGGGEDDWRGFNKLGLGLAFEHTTPDAALPLFHTDRAGWRPLVRRA
jgi:hypothetical protein